MQFSTLALAFVASLASAQKVTVVTVGMGGNLTFTPNNIKVPAGEMVQFQFAAGNHTVTQSTFDDPCSPIAQHNKNVTGFHSGFQPVAASAAMGMIPTYTIMINNTTPLWIYCAQGPHCQKGMVMVINENTAANKTRSLTEYKALAAKAQTSTGGGGAATGGNTGTTTGGTGTGAGNSTNTTPDSSATTSAVATGSAGTVAVPGTLGLLAFVGAALLL